MEGIGDHGAQGGTPRRTRAGLAWSALALGVFGAALFAHCAPLRGRDPHVFVVAARTAGERDAAARYEFAASDRRFAVALVAGNARAFVTRPGRLFDAEPCFPARDSLALGHPGLALGLLGVPAWIATGDPVATFNTAVRALRLLAALAMFLLVADWTRVPAAGVVAGLLYAFHLPSAEALLYPFIFDTTWSVFGLLFARRFFAAGRWRDALALALCCALQLAESFYALLAATLLALPLGAWLLLHYRTRHLRPGPVLVASAGVALAAWLLLSPYLQRPASAALAERGFQVFATWDNLRPGSSASGLAWALAGLGLVLRVRSRPDGDPRWALGLAALAIAVLSIGGNETARVVALARGEVPPPALPDLYGLLARALPWLASVRAPGYAASGVGLCLSLLAGLGSAAVLERLPRRLAAPAALLLIAAAYADAVRPMGLPPSVATYAARMRPPDADIAFFEALAAQGDAGPLFELPVATQLGAGGRGSPILQVLLSTYHGRRTSGCYNSFLPPETRELARIAQALPDPEALAALRQRGFTTLVVHRARAADFVPRLESAGRAGLLREIRSGASMSAWVFAD